MEVVIGALFLLGLLFIAMLPFIILLGLFGMAFRSFGAILLFALKYLLPFGVIGLIVAKLSDKDGDFEWREYLAYLGVAMGVGFVLLLVWLNLPVKPDLPENIQHVIVSYDAGTEIRTATTDTDWLMDNLENNLNSPDYKRTLKEFVEEDENDPEYTLQITDSNGEEYTVIFYNNKVIGIPKGGLTFYYRMKGNATVPQDWAYNVFTLEKKAQMQEIWEPFAQELFSSIEYDTQEQAVTFVIPEVIPGEGYDIDIYIEGSREYTGGEFEPREFFIYEDEQKKDLWVAGQEYSLPVEDIIFSKAHIKVDAPYIEDPYFFDIFPLLPEEVTYKF